MRREVGKILFWAGMLIFLLAKLYLILPVTLALATPRTGDDALVYLWKGRLAATDAPERLPALRDIEMQRSLPETGDGDSAWMRSNVAQRTLGHMTPAYNPLAAMALKLAPDLRWAYALTELVGVVLMVIGIAWFLAELAGPAVAGLALMPMAFAILPNQGINSFIPSTMALSCSLILWAYLWRRGEKASAAGIGLAALVILGLHPIAKVYLALTPALYWVRLGRLQAWRSPAMLRLLLACGAAMVLILLLPKLVPSLRPPPSAIMGSVNLLAGFSGNLTAALGLITGHFLRENLLWVFAVGAGLLLAPRVTLAQPLGWLFLGSVGTLLASLAYWLPGYPAELFSRLWVLVFLLGAAIGARYLLDPAPRVGRRVSIFISVILLCLSAAWWGIKYVPATMNGRNEVLVEPVLRQEFAAIPEGTTLLYAETNIALQAALLLDADRLGALAYPMLKGTGDLTRLLEERSPPILVAPSDVRLNSLSEARTRSFIGRRQGLHFEYVREFNLDRYNGAPLNSVWLRLDGATASAATLSWRALARDGTALARGNLTVVNGFLHLELPADTNALRVTLPDTPTWLAGVGSGAQGSRVLWPWREGWRLAYTLRHKNKPPVIIEFTPAALLARFDAQELALLVDPQQPVISDAGGLIFFRTRYANY